MHEPNPSPNSLTPAQIAAANRIYERCDVWQRSDRALESLRDRMPGFGPEATLLKAVAINALYSTNVYAIVRLARHVQTVLADADLDKAGPELVEKMAWMRDEGPDHKERRHRSFAAKFAHFFIDPERFPIFDSYADRMLRWHLGGAAVAVSKGAPYVEFAEQYDRLVRASGLTGPRRQLDRYLWITGQYHDWHKNHKAPINTELRLMLDAVCDELRLLPPADVGPH